MRQIVYCSNITKSGEPVTPYNHSQFQVEETFTIKQEEMILVVPRNNKNSVCLQHTVYYRKRFRPTEKHYIICLNVYNNSKKVAVIKRNSTLRSLTKKKKIKYSFVMISRQALQCAQYDINKQASTNDD